MIRTYRLVRNNWRKSYKLHGGVRAAARCLAGQLALQSGLPLKRQGHAPTVEIVTFSVVPWMTALWARLISSSLASSNIDAGEIVIGDCCGGFGPKHRQLIKAHDLRIYFCLNDHHGVKIDLFLDRVCRAPYVLIADDDVFWLNSQPLAWALSQLEANPNIAAASLWPRRNPSSVLRHAGISQPMGSHCLLIRRELWRRQNLSFAVAPPPPGVTDWVYDTGDLANQQLLERGFKIAIAPPEIEKHLLAFEGVSSWILKLQAHSRERLTTVLGEIPIRRQKAWQALFLARGLASLIAELPRDTSISEPGTLQADTEPLLVDPARLDIAEQVLQAKSPVGERDEAGTFVERHLDRLREALASHGKL